jgi:hypothetical protein
VAKRHQIEAALRAAGLDADSVELGAILARLAADRLILQHDGFNLFLACERRESMPAAESSSRTSRAEAVPAPP